MKLKTLFITVFSIISSPLFAFEVNTHQAITRLAIGEFEKVGYHWCFVPVGAKPSTNHGAINLKYFVENALLDSENQYGNEIFEYYKDTYFHYARTGTDLHRWSIDFKSNGAFDLVEAGVVLEDAVYPHTQIPGDGRYNNHFYSAQFTTETGYHQQTERALHADSSLDALGKRTDNISWALDDSVKLLTTTRQGEEESRINDYTIQDAFNYYRQSFESTTKEDRRKNQAKLFVSIGFIIHMIQDLHSPAHVRNGPHAGGDYLEIYGREKEGFRLKKGKLDKINNKKIENAINALLDSKVILNYRSYQDYFNNEALWTSQRFFSQAHNLLSRERSCFLNNPILQGFLDCRWNPKADALDFSEDYMREKTTIFDSRNIHPTKSETDTTTPIPGAERYFFSGAGEDRWFYAESNILNTNRTTALLEKGPFGQEYYTMMSVVNGTNKKSYANYESKAMEDTAINVIPRAVISSRDFINYFFRGRMAASFSKKNEVISIQNTSDTLSVISPDLLTFKQGALLKVFYIDDTGVSRELLGLRQALPADLKVGETFVIKNVASNLGNYIPEPGKQNFLVLLDGQIGEDDPNANDDFNLDAQGLSVAYINKSYVKKTLQTQCYAEYDDGYHRKGAVPAYSRDDETDIVTDHFTAQMWQDNSNVATVQKNWWIENPPEITHKPYDDTSGDTATTYCSNLTLGGYNDWRLPTIIELTSIMDFGDAISKYFKNQTYESSYWSSTSEYRPEGDSESNRAWFVGGVVGTPGTGFKENLSNVRCVRSINN